MRNPLFEKAAQLEQSQQEQSSPADDQVQLMRVATIVEQYPEVKSWHWRVLHVPEKAPRLMVTDRGWTRVGETNTLDASWFFPMGPRVAILGYSDSPGLSLRRNPFEEHLYLSNGYVEWLNANAWDDPWFNALYAHPDDRQLLETLPDHRNIVVDPRGPYRSMETKGFKD